MALTQPVRRLEKKNGTRIPNTEFAKRFIITKHDRSGTHVMAQTESEQFAQEILQAFNQSVHVPGQQTKMAYRTLMRPTGFSVRSFPTAIRWY